MFKIGDFSRIGRTTIRTLRYYDEIGLLKPVKSDEITGYRYYSIDQLPRLQRITLLKNLGLSLEDIRDLLEKDLPAGEIRRLLHVRKNEIEDRLDAENERLRQVESWLRKIDHDEKVPFDVKVIEKDMPEMLVIGKRFFFEGGDGIRDVIFKLYDELQKPFNRNIEVPHPVMTLCYEEEYQEKGADIEVVFPVSARPELNDSSISFRTLPACRVLSLTHKGSYHSFYDVAYIYTPLEKYIEEHNLELILPDRELYLNNPLEVPSGECLTEFQFPYKNKEMD